MRGLFASDWVWAVIGRSVLDDLGSSEPDVPPLTESHCPIRPWSAKANDPARSTLPLTNEVNSVPHIVGKRYMQQVKRQYPAAGLWKLAPDFSQLVSKCCQTASLCELRNFPFTYKDKSGR